MTGLERAREPQIHISSEMWRMFGVLEEWEKKGTPWFQADVLGEKFGDLCNKAQERQFYNDFKKLVRTGALEERLAGKPTCKGPWSELPLLQEGQNQHLYFKLADENSPPVKIGPFD